MKFRVSVLWAVLATVMSGAISAQSQDSPHFHDVRDITDDVLKSEYFSWAFGRLQEQHPEYPWFPSTKLDEATYLILVEYQDRSVFVCFADEFIASSRPEPGMHSVTVIGPAVIFPVFGEGKAKFKNLRYVVPLGKVPDLAERDRIVLEAETAQTFADDAGKHGTLTRAQFYSIPDDAVRERLARLMGAYFPGPPKKDP